MFENVLIAEDHQRLNHSVQQTTRELGITDPQYAYYYDDVLLRLQHALRDGKPFELSGEKPAARFKGTRIFSGIQPVICQCVV